MRRILVAVVVLATSGCSLPFMTDTAGALSAAQRFASAWAKLNDAGLNDMYGVLDAQSQASIARAKFSERYSAVEDRMFLRRLDIKVGAATATNGGVHTDLSVTYRTRYFGTFKRPVPVTLRRENNVWRIAWTPAMILPELAGDRFLRESHEVPQRGSILARDGTPLAVSTDQGRTYPMHTLAAHLIGYVAPDGTGQAGLEKSLDKVLAGTPGGTLYTVDSQETRVATISEQTLVPGADVHLSIDVALQQRAETALNVDPKDAVVAEDPRSGKILAIASHPAFDPNAFALGQAQVTQSYLADPGAPLIFRATSGQYPAGSTFKPIAALAALKAGVVTPDEKIPCPAVWLGFGPPGQQNHETSDLGPIDLSTAIARSCNTYFYEVGKRLWEKGSSLLPDMARSFGLGSPTGLRFVPEEAGTVPTPRVGGDATNLAIGQGGLQVTPLQMAVYASALATNGTITRPRVVLSAAQDYPEVTAGQSGARAQDFPIVLADLHRVVADPIGTLVLGFNGERLNLFAKSGTAETTSGSPDIWFIGGGQLPSPSIVVAAVVEEKPNAVHSLDAAQIGRAVIDGAL